MATYTTVLNLTLPGNGEYTNDWDGPNNGNFTIIDQAVGVLQTELQNAAGSASDLTARLAVSLDTAGNLLPVPAIVAAENSFLYGYVNPNNSPIAYSLQQQLDNLATEIWQARGLAASLVAAAAAAQFDFPNQLISGTANSNGYPTYIGSTGANVQVDGSVTPLIMQISGNMTHIRTLKTLTISGAAATYLVYATYQPNGVITVDGSSLQEGATGSDSLNNMTIFTDETVNFTLQDVKAGDLLTLLGTYGTGDTGQYLIQQVEPTGFGFNMLQIIGNFPVGDQSAINYTITDPHAVVLGFVVNGGAVPANSLVIGEADFDGTSISAVRPRCYHNDFIGEWRAVTVAGPVVLAEEIYNHWLGTDKIDLTVQVSQANDGSQPVEEISLSQLTNNLAIAINNTLAISVGNGTLAFTPGSGGGSLSGTVTGSLSGNVTGSLSGTVNETRSLAAKWDRNQIHVKGLTAGVFYTDYNGVVQTSGYLRVLARRRG